MILLPVRQLPGNHDPQRPHYCLPADPNGQAARDGANDEVHRQGIAACSRPLRHNSSALHPLLRLLLQRVSSLRNTPVKSCTGTSVRTRRQGEPQLLCTACQLPLL